MSIEAPETVFVNTRVVACDGSEGALGHPRVYLNLGDDNMVECPYCDRRFVYDPAKADPAQSKVA